MKNFKRTFLYRYLLITVSVPFLYNNCNAQSLASTLPKLPTITTAPANTFLVEKYLIGYNDVSKVQFLNDSVLYAQGWNNLPQAIFWKKIMALSPDSAIVSNSVNREMLDKIDFKSWNNLSETSKTLYRDSIRKYNNIPDSTAIFITGGKRNFYEFKKAIPTISKAVNAFNSFGVDPWYAQAIILIESPGKFNTKSTVGANGPFQLMKSVAVKYGLKVNKYVDERTDVEKSALAASKLISRICIPYVRKMLDSTPVVYNETDLFFRLLVLHAYHAGAGNLSGVIKKINPCEGGMPLIQQVWQTTYRGFKNSSQNYSQLALAAFISFDELTKSDSIYEIEGDRMFNNYMACKCTPYDPCDYLGNCITTYEKDLVNGTIPFDYFISKVKTVETHLSGLAPFQYPYNDNHLNEIGFQLLKSKKVEEAYKIFKHNETEYPNSWTVYHGLGEAYRIMGNTDQAIKSYRKSLKLNPDNQDSQRALARLGYK